MTRDLHFPRSTLVFINDRYDDGLNCRSRDRLPLRTEKITASENRFSASLSFLFLGNDSIARFAGLALPQCYRLLSY